MNGAIGFPRVSATRYQSLNNAAGRLDQRGLKKVQYYLRRFVSIV